MNSILNNQQYIAHNIHINIIKEEDTAIEIKMTFMFYHSIMASNIVVL